MDRLDRIEQILEQLAKDRAEERKEREKEEKLRKERQKEQNRLWAKLRKEREERQKEQDRLWAKLRKEREEERKEWKEHWAKSEERWAKSEERWERLEKRMDDVNEQLGNIGANLGDSAEELFYRSLKREPILGGIRYDSIERNVKDLKGKAEYDILLFNGTAVAIVEVKSKAHPDKIKKLAKQKVEAFRRGYPELESHKLYFGLASTVTNKQLIAKAREAGIYLLTQDGVHVEVVNTDVRCF